MTILALDTTSEYGSIAIRSNGRTVTEITMHSPDGFAHVIFGRLEKLKNEAKLSLECVDCFAAAAGPGSFTGVRVGLSAVKGVAESIGKPVIGISNLRALSSFGKNASRPRAVFLDARRGQIYGAVYDPELRPVMPEMVLPFSAWLETLDPVGEYEFVSTPGAPFSLDGSPFAGMPFIEAPRALAGAVASCAELDGKAGKWLDPAAVDANYVRRSDAELFWKE